MDSNHKFLAIDAFFRAANFLSIGQIYLRSNCLLKEPLKKEHIKSRLLGHWGTTPGLNFIYAHLNHLIQEKDADMIYITGPGHGGPALRSCVYLEETMSEFYPDISMDQKGIEKLMREFSWPGGVPSHVSPHVPGSIHEGGELGYSLAHAYGTVMDNPNLIACCVVGDGEAETGPLATAWQGNKFINPKRDGVVLPILHLNGYKISGPTILARMDDDKLQKFFEGMNYTVRFVEGDDPHVLHQTMHDALEWAYEEIQKIKSSFSHTVPNYPLIVMRTPKGWGCPKIVDGKKIEGSFRSHQVPINKIDEEHLKIIENWMRSYQIEELFDSQGKIHDIVRQNIPKKEKRMSQSPHTNGGHLLKDLSIPDITSYEVELNKPGNVIAEATRQMGKMVRDIYAKNPKNFRLFCPDETNSNRFGNAFEVTKRMYLGEIEDGDEDLAPDGRVIEVLSEHQCQGWLEGYLLTGRHGLFPCYEAFALIVDSMLHQHGKWLKMCGEIPWRKPIASLNYILTSHAWRQDHNGFSHQGPGFIESVLQKKSSVARIYLPPDANTLLSVADHCFRSKNYINLIVCGKQPELQWLTLDQAKEHCARGASIWDFASNDNGSPDVILACAGDVPTLETMAATSILRKQFPDIKVRVVNVVDLFTLTPKDFHPHGMEKEEFIRLFTENTPVIFAFHGHPRVIHEVIHRRENVERFHVKGYIEEGTTTTPFDMVVCNQISRFHIAMEAVSRIPRLTSIGKDFIDSTQKKLKMHKEYIHENGVDMPEITDWRWDL